MVATEAQRNDLNKRRSVAYLEVSAYQGTWWALGPTTTRGVWGHAPPENFENYRCSEVCSGAFWRVLKPCTNLAISNKIDLKTSFPVPISLVALGFDQVQQQYLLEYHQQRWQCEGGCGLLK